MDQYVIDINTCMLYYDIIELVDLIEKHGTEDFKEMYLDYFKEKIKEHEKPIDK